MEDFLSEPSNSKYCLIVVGYKPGEDRYGYPIMVPVKCGGEIVKTTVSESPKIYQYTCSKCGYYWGVKNGLKFPGAGIENILPKN